MAKKKDDTLLIIGGVAAVGIIGYMIYKKQTAAPLPTATAIHPVTTTPQLGQGNLITQLTTGLTSIINDLTGGSSSNVPNPNNQLPDAQSATYIPDSNPTVTLPQPGTDDAYLTMMEYANTSDPTA